MTTTWTKRWIVAAAMVPTAALLCACGCSKLTYDRWQTIQVGQATPEAVEATLGEPWKKADNTWVYSDTDREITATVTFKDNKVDGTEWTAPKHALEHRGGHPLQPGESDHLHVQEVK